MRRYKEKNKLDVTLGLQMVLLPDFKDQIIPTVKIGKGLGVDHVIIKHCSDDKKGRLGVNYEAYKKLLDIKTGRNLFR